MNNTLIIAEAGVNHNGSLEMAIELIDAAAEAGADIVKFQTFKSEAVISRFAKKAEYQQKATGSDETQLEMVKRLELGLEAHQQLLTHCRQRQISFLSTPFDIQSVKLLVDDIGVEKLKIPSGEITNAPLLLRIAQTRRPVILSTGMSLLGEIEQALGVLAFGYTKSNESKPSLAAFESAYCSAEGQAALKRYVTLLHCTTEYPAPLEDVNLQVMDTMKRAFGLPVGYSDHTQGIVVPIAAVALGAVVIEKHFTLDRNLPGPDHKASLEPLELGKMVDAIRQVEIALGNRRKIPAPSELKNRSVARKSLVAATAIVAGEKLTAENVTTKRPGDGISPMRYWELLGQIANKAYQVDEPI